MLSHAAAIRLFDRRRKAWLAEDHDGYLACWAPDMRFASPVHDPPIVGREAFAALVAASAESVLPRAFHVHHLSVDGPVVLAEWTIGVEIRATEVELSWDGMSRSKYRGELIADWREYWNPDDVESIRNA